MMVKCNTPMINVATAVVQLDQPFIACALHGTYIYAHAVIAWTVHAHHLGYILSNSLCSSIRLAILIAVKAITIH